MKTKSEEKTLFPDDYIDPAYSWPKNKIKTTFGISTTSWTTLVQQTSRSGHFLRPRPLWKKCKIPEVPKEYKLVQFCPQVGQEDSQIPPEVGNNICLAFTRSKDIKINSRNKVLKWCWWTHFGLEKVGSPVGPII